MLMREEKSFRFLRAQLRAGKRAAVRIGDPARPAERSAERESVRSGNGQYVDTVHGVETLVEAAKGSFRGTLRNFGFVASDWARATATATAIRNGCIIVGEMLDGRLEIEITECPSLTLFGVAL
jgi:hypothetical protein